MSSMLRDILKAEQNARESVLEAERTREQTYALIEEEKKKIVSQSLQQARDEALKLRQERLAAAEGELEGAREQSEAQTAALRLLEKKRFDRWCDEIFAEVTGESE